MKKKRVYIAYTGGTIGMVNSANGYKPAADYLKERMSLIEELEDDIMPEYDIHEYNPLLDSSNMTPQNWVTIAKDIANNYDKYDGFVVLHGTDTMAYTASALSFMLQGIQKPVILTGSQIPLCEIRNDGRKNLITAMMLAAHYDIPEVCLYFGDKLLRGNRSVKVKADQLDAFDSPNFPPLGTAGINIKVNWEMVQQGKKADLDIRNIGDHFISALHLFPGISAQVVDNILKPPLKGLVLETYGRGNGPDQNKELLEVIKKATDRGIIVVASTQCLEGAVSLGEYAAGAELKKAGVISGYDMTTEAALAKLYYLFSQDLSIAEVKEMMQSNLCGELTKPLSE